MNELNKLEKMLYIVTEDGEVVDEVSSDETVAKLRVGDRVYRRDPEKEKKRLVVIKMPFIKVNTEALSIVGKNHLVLKMMQYIEYQTGRLVFPNGVTINRKNLAKACNVSLITINRNLPKIIEQDIVKIVKGGRDDVFFFNPFIAHFGKFVTCSLYEMFKDSQWALECRKDCKNE